MMVINATAGSAVDGIRLDDQLLNRLWPAMPDDERARSANDLMILMLTLAYASKENMNITQADHFVQSNVSRIS